MSKVQSKYSRSRERKLTAKEEAFVRHYCLTKSATKAATLAGYCKGQVSKASSFLKKPHIEKAVRNRSKHLLRRIERTDADVIQELSDIAFQDPISFMKNDAKDGEPERWVWKSPDELTPAQRSCIRSVRVYAARLNKETGKMDPERYQYSFHDKMTALTQMGRHFGLFEDSINITGEARRFADLPMETLMRVRDTIRSELAKPTNTIEGETISGKSLSDDRRLDS